MPQLKTIPAKACAFAADLEVGTNGEDAKTAPITLLARTGQPINNWFWGRVVHDLGGMTVAKAKIPLDYCHCDDEVIGYANNFDTSTGDLVAKGALIPYSANPEDKATEVIYKSQAGIPYEASIFFDGPLAIEDVGAGAKAMVNGQEMEGPLTIVRQWTLRGIAVCPYGADPGTSSEMKFANRGDVQATVLDNKEMQMSATAEATASAAETVEAKATEDTAVETTAPVAEVVEASEPAAEPAKVEEEAAVPVTAPVEATALSEGQKFLKAFGDKGGVWFAEGKTFSEAQELHFASIVAERDQFAKENLELKAKLVETRGEKDPVSFSVDSAEPVKPEPKKFAHLGDGLSKFAAGIKFKK